MCNTFLLNERMTWDILIKNNANGEVQTSLPKYVEEKGLLSG